MAYVVYTISSQRHPDTVVFIRSGAPIASDHNYFDYTSTVASSTSLYPSLHCSHCSVFTSHQSTSTHSLTPSACLLLTAQSAPLSAHSVPSTSTSQQLRYSVLTQQAHCPFLVHLQLTASPPSVSLFAHSSDDGCRCLALANRVPSCHFPTSTARRHHLCEYECSHRRTNRSDGRYFRG